MRKTKNENTHAFASGRGTAPSDIKQEPRTYTMERLIMVLQSSINNNNNFILNKIFKFKI